MVLHLPYSRELCSHHKLASFYCFEWGWLASIELPALEGRKKNFQKCEGQTPSTPESQDVLLVLLIWAHQWEFQDSALLLTLESCHLFFCTAHLCLVLQVWNKEHPWLPPKGVSAFPAGRMVTETRGPPYREGKDEEKGGMGSQKNGQGW